MSFSVNGPFVTLTDPVILDQVAHFAAKMNENKPDYYQSSVVGDNSHGGKAGEWIAWYICQEWGWEVTKPDGWIPNYSEFRPDLQIRLPGRDRVITLNVKTQPVYSQHRFGACRWIVQGKSETRREDRDILDPDSDGWVMLLLESQLPKGEKAFRARLAGLVPVKWLHNPVSILTKNGLKADRKDKWLIRRDCFPRTGDQKFGVFNPFSRGVDIVTSGL